MGLTKNLIVFCVSIITFFTSYKALAVDGYKNIKFGSSIEDLKKEKVCTITEKPIVENGISTYTCYDFKFGGEKRMAFFYFVDKKFKRLAFLAGDSISEAGPLLSVLTDKYGKPSSPAKNDALASFDKGLRDEVSAGFDSDSIFIKIFRSENTISVMMIYTSSDFEKLTDNLKKRSIASDL